MENWALSIAYDFIVRSSNHSSRSNEPSHEHVTKMSGHCIQLCDITCTTANYRQQNSEWPIGHNVGAHRDTTVATLTYTVTWQRSVKPQPSPDDNINQCLKLWIWSCHASLLALPSASRICSWKCFSACCSLKCGTNVLFKCLLMALTLCSSGMPTFTIMRNSVMMSFRSRRSTKYARTHRSLNLKTCKHEYYYTYVCWFAHTRSLRQSAIKLKGKLLWLHGKKSTKISN